MKVAIKKRGAVYGVIVLMLCVAIYLNSSYVQTPEDLIIADTMATSDAVTELDAIVAQTVATEEEDYFAASRLSREQARDEAISILKDTMADENAAETSIVEAGEMISALASYSVTEARIESLIQAKGYTDAVVFLSGDSASVVVSAMAEGFDETDAAVIRDLVLTETALTAAQIRIVEAS